jgi:hypothetical protein
VSFSRLAARKRRPEPPPAREEVVATITRWRIGLPETLGHQRCWVVWVRYAKPGKPGKFDKVPYYITGHQRHGTNGNPADREQLADLDGAIRAYRQGRYHGIGVALLPSVPWWALDLDHCINAAGRLSALAKRVVASGTYCERSPSGSGLRALFRGKIALNAKNHDAGVETFNDRGFVTITGDRVGVGVKLLPCPLALRKEIRSTVRAGSKAAATAGGSHEPIPAPADISKLRLPSAVWRRLRNPYPAGCDRSSMAFSIAWGLAREGVKREQALDLMAHPDLTVLEPALERRRGDIESARRWLWKYVVLPAYAGAGEAR